MKEPSRKKGKAGIIIWTTLVISIGYAILRYHIAGNVPWKDFPFFILNKGLSLSAFIILTINFSLGPLKNLGLKIQEEWLNSRKALGMIGFLIVFIHALMSFVLLRPSIFAKFFHEDGGLTLLAGLSMLAGILGLVVLWVMNLSFQTYLKEDSQLISFLTSRRFMLAALLLGTAHVFFMGYEGWLTPNNWNGGLPPISLVSFAFSSLGYTVNLLGRK